MSAVAVQAVVTGHADGPVVVLSNSLGATYRMWDTQLADLGQQFRLVRYNTRGHGESPVPNGPYTVDDLADDLIALLDRLDVERAHLIGLSLGGMTALRIAARNPQRVGRLALLCTATRIPPAAAWVERAATVRAHGSGALAASVVQRWFTPEYLAAHPDIRSASEAMITATAAEGYAGCCEAIATLDLGDDLAGIDAPTLAIAGADDPVTPPERLDEIATGVKDGRLLVVSHSAHLANAEQPGIVTPALIEFLERP